jgi:hypothetical protein
MDSLGLIHSVLENVPEDQMKSRMWKTARTVL